MASAVRVLCARVCVCLSSFLLTLPAVNPAQCSFYFSQDFFFLICWVLLSSILLLINALLFCRSAYITNIHFRDM